MLIYIGLDDTDTLESRGTGSLARQIAANLAERYTLLGVTRHQLLLDERIPYTAKNSSAAICIQADSTTQLTSIFKQVRLMMMDNLEIGSDPGLCVASDVQANRLVEFGLQTKIAVKTQSDARNLAEREEILIEGLAGSRDGIIGAMAAVGLSACGDDGRYIQVGVVRELSGPQPLPALFNAGIQAIQTLDGKDVEHGLVIGDKMRPARRQSKPVLFVEWSEPYWIPQKMD